ncbi:pyruvate kinase [Azotobacter vinelandii DJ]|uniref:pyruvate kinase n=1 Tax=Azotobacter vinelandii TaxID=354 RepID=UPI0030D4E23D
MQRRTKIVATLGSATETPEAIEGLVKAGVDVVRLNFSHGKAKEHQARATLVREMAAKEGVKAIVCLTESGDTPRLMSRIRSHLPIYAFSRHPRTQSRVALFRGVHPIPFEADRIAEAELNARAVKELLQRRLVAEGDRVLITKGAGHAQGGTDTLRIVRVGDVIH